MSFDTLSPGSDVPEEVNVIIEIPANSDPVKYEVDKDSGTLMVDRFMASPMFYPCNYGYCLLYTSPSPRDGLLSRMPSSA